MEIISSIFNIVIAMGVFGFLSFLVIGAMSKLTNSSAYYRGSKMADSGSLEDAYDAIKATSKKQIRIKLEKKAKNDVFQTG